MKHKLIFYIILAMQFHYYCNAQKDYRISFGATVPVKLTEKYLKVGYKIQYGLDVNILKNLFFSPGLSMSFNNRNKNYRYGFDDEPFFINNPDLIETNELIFKQLTNGCPENSTQLYLFNSMFALELKYYILKFNNLSSYINASLNLNYSLSKAPKYYFTYNSDGILTEVTLTDANLRHQFNIGYHVGLGVRYAFKNSNSVFLEGTYSSFPFIEFGKNPAKCGLIPVVFGFNARIRKKSDKNE